MENRTILAVFSIPILALAAVIVAVPVLMPPGMYAGLDGTPGYMDHDWHDGLPASLIYMLGDLFCHQEEARTFMVNGSQMAFCIRDMGLLIGLATGLLSGSVRVDDMTSRKVPVLALLMMAFTVVEWVAEHSMGDMPAWRFSSALVSGTGAGLFLSWMLCRGTVDTAGGRRFSAQFPTMGRAESVVGATCALPSDPPAPDLGCPALGNEWVAEAVIHKRYCSGTSEDVRRDGRGNCSGP